MSDEKIDRIDQRVTELVNITGNLVTAVTELSMQVKEVTVQVKEVTVQVKENTEQIKVQGEQIKVQSVQIKLHSEQINKLTESQQIMSGQLADIARVVIKTDKRLGNLEQKVDEGFEELGKGFSVANRKIDWTTNTSLDALTRVEDLESRVAQIEQRIAV